ncbi:hypothetical protein GA0115245_127319 [Streptomyces sp. di188]|nr:hypothetical protein GA0115238_139318 [Streptomyces sp. di50b]SCE24959.1 hypothetical protein GA0115245_127319 [Streptomyces sp. di188]
MALVASTALTGCAAERDDDVYTVLNSSTDETYHRWDAEAMARCGKRLGVTVEQQSVPASQVMTKALRMAMFALTLNTTDDVKPVTLGIYQYIGAHFGDWGSVMAAAVLSAVPAAILLVLAQRYIAAGITGGSVK